MSIRWSLLSGMRAAWHENAFHITGYSYFFRLTIPKQSKLYITGHLCWEFPSNWWHYWPFVLGNPLAGNRWISCIKGLWCEILFHAKTSLSPSKQSIVSIKGNFQSIIVRETGAISRQDEMWQGGGFVVKLAKLWKTWLIIIPLLIFGCWGHLCVITTDVANLGNKIGINYIDIFICSHYFLR